MRVCGCAVVCVHARTVLQRAKDAANIANDVIRYGMCASMCMCVCVSGYMRTHEFLLLLALLHFFFSEFITIFFSFLYSFCCGVMGKGSARAVAVLMNANINKDKHMADSAVVSTRASEQQQNQSALISLPFIAAASISFFVCFAYVPFSFLFSFVFFSPLFLLFTSFFFNISDKRRVYVKHLCVWLCLLTLLDTFLIALAQAKRTASMWC